MELLQTIAGSSTGTEPNNHSVPLSSSTTQRSTITNDRPKDNTCSNNPQQQQPPMAIPRRSFRLPKLAKGRSTSNSDIQDKKKNKNNQSSHHSPKVPIPLHPHSSSQEQQQTLDSSTPSLVQQSDNNNNKTPTRNKDQASSSSASVVVLNLEGLSFHMPRVSNSYSYDYSSISSTGSGSHQQPQTSSWTKQQYRRSSSAPYLSSHPPRRQATLPPLRNRLGNASSPSPAGGSPVSHNSSFGSSSSSSSSQNGKRPVSPLYFQMDFATNADETKHITRLHKVLSKLTFWNNNNSENENGLHQNESDTKNSKKPTKRNNTKKKKKKKLNKKQPQRIPVTSSSSQPFPMKIPRSPSSSPAPPPIKASTSDSKSPLVLRQLFLPQRQHNHTFSTNSTDSTFANLSPPMENNCNNVNNGTAAEVWEDSYHSPSKLNTTCTTTANTTSSSSVSVTRNHTASSLADWEPIVSVSAEWYEADDDDHVVLLSASDDRREQTASPWQWRNSEQYNAEYAAPNDSSQNSTKKNDEDDCDPHDNFETIWYPKWRMLDESFHNTSHSSNQSLPNVHPYHKDKNNNNNDQDNRSIAMVKSILVDEEDEDDDADSSGDDENDDLLDQDPQEQQHRIMEELEVLSSEVMTHRNPAALGLDLGPEKENDYSNANNYEIEYDINKNHVNAMNKHYHGKEDKDEEENDDDNDPIRMSSSPTFLKDMSVWLRVRQRWRNTVQGVLSPSGSGGANSSSAGSGKQTGTTLSGQQRAETPTKTRTNRWRSPSTCTPNRKSRNCNDMDKIKPAGNDPEEIFDDIRCNLVASAQQPEEQSGTHSSKPPVTRTLELDDRYNQVVAAHSSSSSTVETTFNLLMDAEPNESNTPDEPLLLTSTPTRHQGDDDNNKNASPTRTPSKHRRNHSSGGNSFRSNIFKLNCSRDDSGREELEWSVLDSDIEQCTHHHPQMPQRKLQGDEQKDKAYKTPFSKPPQPHTESSPCSQDVQYGDLNTLSSTSFSFCDHPPTLAVTLDPQEQCAQLVFLPPTTTSTPTPTTFSLPTTAQAHDSNTGKKDPLTIQAVPDGAADLQVAPAPSCTSNALFSDFTLSDVVQFPFSSSLAQIDEKGKDETSNTQKKDRNQNKGATPSKDENDPIAEIASRLRSSSSYTSGREPDGQYFRVDSPINDNKGTEQEEPLSPPSPRSTSGVERRYNSAVDAAATAAVAAAGGRALDNETPVARARRLASLIEKKQLPTHNHHEGQENKIIAPSTNQGSVLFIDQSPQPTKAVPGKSTFVNAVLFDEPPTCDDPFNLPTRQTRQAPDEGNGPPSDANKTQNQGLFEMVHSRWFEPILNYTLNEEVSMSPFCGPPQNSARFTQTATPGTAISPALSLSRSESPMARHPTPFGFKSTVPKPRNPLWNASSPSYIQAQVSESTTSYDHPGQHADYACYPFGGDATDSSTEHGSLFHTPERQRPQKQSFDDSRDLTAFFSSPSSGTTTQISSLTSLT